MSFAETHWFEGTIPTVWASHPLKKKKHTLLGDRYNNEGSLNLIIKYTPGLK